MTQVTQFCHIMTMILVLCETSCSFLNIRYCQRYLHSVNLILFTLILVHLFLHVSPHHSRHLHSHHLSLPRSFTPDLKTCLFRKSFSHPMWAQECCWNKPTSFPDFNAVWGNNHGSFVLLCFMLFASQLCTVCIFCFVLYFPAGTNINSTE